MCSALADATPSKVERCKLCLLPRSANGFTFDDEGVCRLCHAARLLPKDHAGLAKEQRRQRLNESIAEIKRRGQGRKYDCIVGVSGGRDSTYLLYELVRRHGLRCLAAYYRTPFTSDVIDANVRRMAERLNVPLECMDISPDYHARLAREMVMLWKRKPLPVIGNLACCPCKLVNREAHKIAKRYDIRSLVYGGNRYEEFQLSAGQLRNIDSAKKHSFKMQALEATVYVKRGLSLLFKCFPIWKYIPTGFWASFMYRCPHTVYLRLRYPGMYRVEYFFQAEWVEEDCKRALEEVGWERPPGCHSDWKADCSLAEWKNYMFRTNTGVNYMEALLSNMVRDGVLTREEGLRRLELEGRDSEERYADVARVFGVPKEKLFR